MDCHQASQNPSQTSPGHRSADDKRTGDDLAKIKIQRSAVERLPMPAEGSSPVYYFDDALAGFAVRVSPKGAKAFLVQGRVNGKTVRHALGRFPIVSPEEARRRARLILSDMAGGMAPEKPRDAVLVGAVLDEWLNVHVGLKLKPRTALDYRKIVAQVLRPELGNRPIEAVERTEIAALHHARRGTPRRANYIIAVARSFFSYAEDAGHRPSDTNPAKRIRAYPENRRERFLSNDEIGRAAAAITAAQRAGKVSGYAAAGLLLCMLTGARQGEIKWLRWREVDFERRLLLLEDSKTGRRPIYLSEPALVILRALPRVIGNDYVIVGDKVGEPYQRLSNAWIKIRATVGLDDVRLHDLRHTFASVGASEALSLPMIGRLLGHTVPATTQRYAHLAADPVREANERIGMRIAGLIEAGGAIQTVEHGGEPDADS
jgi:integrase